MYEAVSTRAPISTKVTGVSAVALGLMLAGYAFANGLGAKIADALAPPMVVLQLDEPKPPPEKLDEPDLSTKVDAPVPPPPVLPDDDFRVDKKEPPPLTIDPPKLPPVDPGGGVAPPPRAAVRVLPKMLARDKPEYPMSEIRAHREGTTGLDLCVDARGRVTSVGLASSSGSERLDETAMKWARNARFAPGTLDGAAAAMCGARVLYEWKITD